MERRLAQFNTVQQMALSNAKESFSCAAETRIERRTATTVYEQKLEECAQQNYSGTMEEEASQA